MTKNDAHSVTKEAKGLFPTLTPEQLKLVAEIVAPYRFDRATAILKTHRINHPEFMHFGQLTEALRGDAEKHSDRRREFAAEKMVQGIRRMARGQWGILEYENLSDLEVIRKHFGHLRSCITDDNIVLRLYVFKHVRIALEEIGIDNADAIEVACEVAGMTESELHRKIDEVIAHEHMDQRLPIAKAVLAM